MPVTFAASDPGEIFDQILDQTDLLPPPEQVNRATDALARARAETPDDRMLVSKGCLALSLAHYINGNPMQALSILGPCMDAQVAALDINLWVRMRSMHAGMLVSNGRIAESLEEYRQILSEDFPGASTDMLLRLRANYSAVLFESGQVLAAIDELQEVIYKGIETDNKIVVAGAGNNLVITLIEQRMYSSAMAWVDRLWPIVGTMGDHYTKLSLELHELQLQTRLGYPQKAADGLRAFVDKYDVQDVGAVIYGSAYEYYSEALRAIGKPREALNAATKATELLAAVPMESTDAQLALARAQLANKDYRSALASVAIAESTPLPTPIRDEESKAIKLRALLGATGNEVAAAELEALLAATATREASTIERNTGYFDARLKAQQQETEIALIQRSREVLAAEAAASVARANELETKALAERRLRNSRLAIFLLVVCSLAVVIYSVASRRFEKRLRVKEVALNERLSRELDEKSEALVRQMDEQAGLERALAKKAQAEAVGRLTGNVAHDFNNLLQVISIANEQMATVAEGETQVSLLDGSNQALQHARVIISQLLAYARRQKLEILPVEFSSYLQRSRALLTAAAGEKVTLQLHDNTDGAAAYLDASQLTTALLNLLSNASDAMPNGGVVVIAATIESIDSGLGSSWHGLMAGEYLKISVSDNGNGMSEVDLERALEPFFTTKNEHSGTGLGLSSVYGFVRQSGGDMKISSALNEGTTVEMCFPLTDSRTAAVPPELSETPRLSSARLMLVEDNSILAKTLLLMLKHTGAEVQHMASADEAMDFLASDSRFDLIVSDVRMPGKHDGLGLYRWVNVNLPAIPVLLMSGFNDRTEADIDVTVIEKPFRQQELLERIQQLLEG